MVIDSRTETSHRMNREKIHIPRALTDREIRFRESFNFQDKFLEGPLRKKRVLPYTSPFVQPIDYHVLRMMKVEFGYDTADFSLRFSLTDSKLTVKDIAALLAAASVLTNEKFEIKFNGRDRAQLFVPNANKIFHTMTKESILSLLSSAMSEESALGDGIIMQGDFNLPDSSEIKFTADDWKSGTELNDITEQFMGITLEEEMNHDNFQSNFIKD
jgi:hypothetical protein